MKKTKEDRISRQPKKQLQLNKETIRNLRERELVEVQGGAGTRGEGGSFGCCQWH